MPLPGIRNIESSTNSLVKVFRQALNEGVTREGWIAFEGPLLLEEALNACAEGSDAGRCRIQTVLASRTAAEKFSRLIERLPKEAELAQVPDRLFGRLAQTESPQGIAALVQDTLYWLVDGALITTRDQGKSWKKISTLKDGRFGPVSGKGEKHLFVLTGAGAVESNDGGATWSAPITLPKELKGVSALTWLEV